MLFLMQSKNFQLMWKKLRNSKWRWLKGSPHKCYKVKKNKQMVLQSWLQISTIFINVLKPKEAGPSNYLWQN